MPALDISPGVLNSIQFNWLINLIAFWNDWQIRTGHHNNATSHHHWRILLSGSSEESPWRARRRWNAPASNVPHSGWNRRFRRISNQPRLASQTSINHKAKYSVNMMGLIWILPTIVRSPTARWPSGALFMIRWTFQDWWGSSKMLAKNESTSTFLPDSPVKSDISIKTWMCSSTKRQQTNKPKPRGEWYIPYLSPRLHALLP